MVTIQRCLLLILRGCLPACLCLCLCVALTLRIAPRPSGEYIAIESMESTYANSVFVNGIAGGIMCYGSGEMDRPVALVQVWGCAGVLHQRCRSRVVEWMMV